MRLHKAIEVDQASTMTLEKVIVAACHLERPFSNNAEPTVNVMVHFSAIRKRLNTYGLFRGAVRKKAIFLTVAKTWQDILSIQSSTAVSVNQRLQSRAIKVLFHLSLPAGDKHAHY